jgi:hypothetical protein
MLALFLCCYRVNVGDVAGVSMVHAASIHPEYGGSIISHLAYFNEVNVECLFISWSVNWLVYTERVRCRR